MPEKGQLAVLARLHGLLDGNEIEYWVFGGWAVDFHAGSISRAHDDLDVAVWAKDAARVDELLKADGWRHTPESGEDGYTSYQLDAVKLEVAFIASDRTGSVYTPLREGGRSVWPEATFGSDLAELRGVRARVVTRRALLTDKSEIRKDPVVAEKDRADVKTLSRLANA
jgi:hypothetical protein